MWQTFLQLILDAQEKRFSFGYQTASQKLLWLLPCPTYNCISIELLSQKIQQTATDHSKWFKMYSPLCCHSHHQISHKSVTFFFFFFSESKFYALQCIYWKTYTESHKQMGLIRKSNQALHLTSGGPLTGYRSKYVTRSSFSFWSCQQSLQKTKFWARRP